MEMAISKLSKKRMVKVEGKVKIKSERYVSV